MPLPPTSDTRYHVGSCLLLSKEEISTSLRDHKSMFFATTRKATTRVRQAAPEPAADVERCQLHYQSLGLAECPGDVSAAGVGEEVIPPAHAR